MATNKKLDNKAVTLKSGKERSRTLLAKTSRRNSAPPMTVQFLLTEYESLAEFWKHTDHRIETGINFYITVFAFTFPGLGLLYQAIKDTQLFILASVPVAATMFILGIILTARITMTDFSKAEYKLGMRLIRRYFADRDPEIAAYLYQPTQGIPSDPEESKRPRPFFHRRLVLIVYLYNSLLGGLTLAGLAWVVLGNSLELATIALTGLVISLVTFAILSIRFQQTTKHLTQDYLRKEHQFG